MAVRQLSALKEIRFTGGHVDLRRILIEVMRSSATRVMKLTLAAPRAGARSAFGLFRGHSSCEGSLAFGSTE